MLQRRVAAAVADGAARPMASCVTPHEQRVADATGGGLFRRGRYLLLKVVAARLHGRVQRACLSRFGRAGFEARTREAGGAEGNGKRIVKGVAWWADVGSPIHGSTLRWLYCIGWMACGARGPDRMLGSLYCGRRPRKLEV